jgi:hypothetical protein
VQLHGNFINASDKMVTPVIKRIRWLSPVSASFWAVIVNGGYVKAVQILASFSGKAKWSQTAAKYIEGTDVDYDFDNNGTSTAVAAAPSNDGYGVTSVTFGAPVQATHKSNIDISGLKVKFMGAFMNHEDRALLPLITDVHWNGATATFWAVIVSGPHTKAVQISATFGGFAPPTQFSVLAAKYIDGHNAAFDFNSGGNAMAVAGSEGADGYGVSAITWVTSGVDKRLTSFDPFGTRVVLHGAFINDGDRAILPLIKDPVWHSPSTSAFWAVICNGNYTKAIQIQATYNGSSTPTFIVAAAKYIEGHNENFDFDTGGTSTAVALSAGDNGYGAASVHLSAATPAEKREYYNDLFGTVVRLHGRFINAEDRHVLPQIKGVKWYGATKATFWAVIVNGGYTKAVQIAANISGKWSWSVQAAKYIEGSNYDFDFESGGTSTSVAGSDGDEGYGATSVSFIHELMAAKIKLHGAFINSSDSVHTPFIGRVRWQSPGVGVFWAVIVNGGYTKAVQIQINHTGHGDPSHTVLAAKYIEGHNIDFDFDSAGTSTSVAAHGGDNGYGVASISW